MIWKENFDVFLCSMSTCLSMWLRRNLHIMVFSPFDGMLLTLILLAAFIFIYLWLYWRRRKMPFLIIHLIIYISIYYFSGRASQKFGLSLDCRRGNFFYIYIYDDGGRGDDHSSSSFFEGLSDLVKKTAEPGEERNSQPSQGVGLRLPGSL